MEAQDLQVPRLQRKHSRIPSQHSSASPRLSPPARSLFLDARPIATRKKKDRKRDAIDFRGPQLIRHLFSAQRRHRRQTTDEGRETRDERRQSPPSRPSLRVLSAECSGPLSGRASARHPGTFARSPARFSIGTDPFSPFKGSARKGKATRPPPSSLTLATRASCSRTDSWHNPPPSSSPIPLPNTDTDAEPHTPRAWTLVLAVLVLALALVFPCGVAHIDPKPPPGRHPSSNSHRHRHHLDLCHRASPSCHIIPHPIIPSHRLRARHV